MRPIHASSAPVLRAGSPPGVCSRRLHGCPRAQVLVCPEKSRPEENKEKALLAYTHAVDIWAMGILAFECLSGKPPFERQSRTETYEYIMYRRQQCPTYFTQEAVEFIHHALSKVRKTGPCARPGWHAGVTPRAVLLRPPRSARR